MTTREVSSKLLIHSAAEIDEAVGKVIRGEVSGTVDIVDDLVTGGATRALSAEQGKIIGSQLDTIKTDLNGYSFVDVPSEVEKELYLEELINPLPPVITDTDKEKILAVNSDGSGVEWIDKPTGGGSGLTLGETSTTAYRGDMGKVAYDHSQVSHAPTTAQKNSDITKAEIEAKLTGTIATHDHNYQLVLNGTDLKLMVNGIEKATVSLASLSGGTPVIYGNIVVSKTTLDITEGSNETFTVALDKAPTNNQVVTLSKTNADVTLSATTLTFTPSNYATPQTITITLAEDADYSNETDIITLTSENVQSVNINVNITDNDEVTPPPTSDIDIMTLGFDSPTEALTIPSALEVVAGKPDYVHPSVLYFPNSWNGFEYWMAINPYPSTQSSYENPCLVASNDGINWITKGNVPIYGITGGATHNSDCHIFMDKNGTTMHYINRMAFNGDGTSIIEVFSSTDGITWTQRQNIIERNVGFDYLSPSVCYFNNKYYMFAVDNKNTDKTLISVLESDSVTGTWTKINDIKVPFSYTIWHLEIKLINNEFIALIQQGDAQGGSLFLGKFTSPTDTELTLREGSILDGITNTWQNALYKSSFNLYSDVLELFVGYKSGKLDSTTTWRVAKTKATVISPTLNIGSEYTQSFVDNFTDTTNWTLNSTTTNSIAVNNNKLEITSDPSGGGAIVLKNIGSYNFAYETIIDKYEVGSGSTVKSGVIFRYKDATQFYGFGYVGATDKSPHLYYSKSGNITQKVKSKLSFYNGCKVSIICKGNNIKAYIDDMLACEMIATEFNGNGLDGRSIGYAATISSIYSQCSVKCLNEDILSYTIANEQLDTKFADYSNNATNYALADKFERANGNVGTSLNGVIYETSTTSPTIASNVLKCNANQYAVVNVNQSNYEATTKIVDSYNNHWLFVRFEDINNNIRVAYQGSTKSVIYIDKVINSTKTTLATIDLGEKTNAPFIFKYTIVDNVLTVYKNNVLVSVITLTDLTTNTKAGVGGQMASCGFDSLIIKKI